MSPKVSAELLGGLLSREKAPIDSASPKIRSDKVSIRGLGLEGSLFSDKARSLPVFYTREFLVTLKNLSRTQKSIYRDLLMHSDFRR